MKAQRASHLLRAVAAALLWAPLCPAVADTGRYRIDSDTITDTRSSLRWARSDNGAEIGWHAALAECKQRGAGWHLPTLDELETLYDPAESVPCGANFCHAAAAFILSGGWFWSGEPSGETHAWGYNLDIGRRDTNAIAGSSYGRALCVW